MKTYLDLLEKLKTLSKEQLKSDIVILEEGLIKDKVLDLLIKDESLFSFNDVDGSSYVDFESDENAKDYDSEKILDKNYPIIQLF